MLSLHILVTETRATIVLDEHKIQKIYKDSTRSDAPKPFVMGLGNWKDRIDQWDGSFDGDGLDTVFTSTANDKQRMNVYVDASKPKVSGKAKELDRKKLMSRPDSDNIKRGGWMLDPSDWRDYEITSVELFPNDVQGDHGPAADTSAWYGRGAKHTGSSVDEGSQGSAIKPDLWYAGNNNGWQVLKETLHFKDYKSSNNSTIRSGSDKNVLHNENVGNIKGKWVAIKTVVYNEPSKKVSSGENAGSDYWPVMIETYMCNCDANGIPDNNWTLKFQCEDDPEKHGGWSSLPHDQPGPSVHTMSWGGPIITCRTDRQSGTGGGYPGMKFKKVSVREIEPGVKY